MLSTRVFLFLTFLLLSIALLPSSALPSAPLAYRKAAPSSSFARSAQPLKLRGGNADAAGTAPGDEGVAAADASSNPGAPPTAFGEVQSAADREKLENFLEQMGEKTEGQNVSSLQSSYSIYELRESGTMVSLTDSPSLASMDSQGNFAFRRVPKTIQLLAFMVPTFGIFLANPILSLVDTASVGQFCSRSELAALGPGTAVCDMVVFLVNFLAVATTSLFASSIARNEGPAASRRVVGVAFSISTMVGIVMSFALIFGGPAMLKLFIGSGSDAAETFELSLSYVRVRGLGAAPTLLCMVAQAACIGAKDSISPLRAVAVQAVFNIFLDILFVGPLKTGVTGAAIATAISQLAGALYLMACVDARLVEMEKEGAAYDGGNILGAPKDEKSESRGLLHTVAGLFAWPTKKEALTFTQFAGPLFLISFGRSYTWYVCTPGAAAAGTVALAAHQIVINVFFLFTIAGESVFQTAQAFLPEFQEAQQRAKTESKIAHEEATEKVKKLAKKLIAIAFFIGFLQSAISLIPTYLFPQVFCSDKEVIAAVRKTSGLLAASIFPHCMTVCIEALLLNSKDLDFLGIAYVIKSVLWTVFVFNYVIAIKPSLTVLWIGMMGFQYIRGITWMTRMLVSGKKLGIPVYVRKHRRRKVPVSHAAQPVAGGPAA